MDKRMTNERGILKVDSKTRAAARPADITCELTTQGSLELTPSSPHPSVDRLSVTWAEPEDSMASGVNLYHLPTDTAITNELKAVGDGSDGEDYSVSLSAVLRQRRASVRRSRKGRSRRPSSPYLPEDSRSRRRSSVLTTSSGDTAITMEESVTQEQIMENIHVHKEVLGAVKQQAYDMRRKLKIVHQAKSYIKRHEGQLQERLAQSKSTKDIYARFNILLSTKWQQLKREAANMSNLAIPWELRIKEIESHFGSVVASYFTFLRWLFWVNLVIGFVLVVFVIIPEYLTANPKQDGERKVLLEEERRNATNLLTLWEFEGILKCSPIFYGYYSNIERPEYRMPLAYFLTGLVVYIYSFVATLRKMAENSRMSKLSEKEDECIFSWKLFTGWDFMIGNAETAHNRIASVILGFKEALLEEAEKKKDLRNWRIISLRALVNLCVIVLLAVSAYAVVTVVSRSDDQNKVRSWWRENETTVVVTVISITFPVFFELLGFLEHYHPRKQLRLQLARIMLLNLLNLYSLIFALFSKIEGMSKELDSLQPSLNTSTNLNTTIMNSTLELNDTFNANLSSNCSEVKVPCMPCELLIQLPIPLIITTLGLVTFTTTPTSPTKILQMNELTLADNDRTNHTNIPAESLIEIRKHLEDSLNFTTDTTMIMPSDDTTVNTIDIAIYNELTRLREIADTSGKGIDDDETSTESDEEDNDYNFEYTSKEIIDIESSTTDIKLSTDSYTSNTDDTSNALETSSISDMSTNSELLETDGNTSDTTTPNGTSLIEFETTLGESSFTEYETTSSGTFFSEYETSPNGTSSTEYENTNDINSTTSKDSSTESSWHSNKTTYTSLNTDKSYETTERYSYSDKSSTINYQIVPNNLICPNMTFKCFFNCSGKNITQIYIIFNCTVIEKFCLINKCFTNNNENYMNKNLPENIIKKNRTMIDIVYLDQNNRKMYNLTLETKKKLNKLCWETMFGQELVKLTMMDLVFVLLGTLFMDFFRALFVRYFNRCWCWNLEKKFPEYGDFKIAENILHLINNQGMVWMGMFFSPGLVVLNVFKLVIMMYLRSWTVMTCNVPHEVVFRVSKSNNFYLALLLTMLFLCVLPVGYSIVWVKPSWHCGPFSEYEKIYQIITNNIYKILPTSLNFALEYIASPAIVIPLLVLLILIIYYLTSLTNSLREANNDLKIQLRRERTEEKRKMFQLADTRRKGGSAEMDNTPYSRWKKALPALPFSKSIDSDDRKDTTGDDQKPKKVSKKKGGIFAKIVGIALDRKSEVEDISENNVSLSPNADDETDTDFHETLPKEVLKAKDITVPKIIEQTKKRAVVEFKPIHEEKFKPSLMKAIDKLKAKSIKEADIEDSGSRSEILNIQTPSKFENLEDMRANDISRNEIDDAQDLINNKKLCRKQTSVSSSQSKQSDTVIPVITISATESDEELLQTKKLQSQQEPPGSVQLNLEHEKRENSIKATKKSSSELKTLRRQSTVDSIHDQKPTKDKRDEHGHKYQYSL